MVESLTLIINVVAGGSLMSKTFEEAYKLIEEMSTNNFSWPSNLINPNRVASAYEYDALSIFIAQVTTIFKKWDTFIVSL
ncbi:hypothetical protein MA16_Dca028971 [Dendrobium catenatum]|uniref:Uncharacterized protein n=1 Tax=Dendrobium catenatum TaxID=906689 RepID=A0A2I0V7D8_9ASPA|nr:hypothetical protein MA16_Dca028971 [Dendrobium catenatum]